MSDHGRGETESALVYPVFSRRSGGLSLGINLFPSRKICNFDCPYCEVVPFRNDAAFDPERLRAELDAWAASRDPAIAVKDLCISGNGEPTLSPHLAEVLDLLADFRTRALGGRPGGTDLVIITNSTGFADSGSSAILSRAAEREGLRIWAKLDGATPEWFARMSASAIPFTGTVDALLDFARGTPVIIQTMLCAVDGVRPGPGEAMALGRLLASLMARGARLSELHLYTKARPDQNGRTDPLNDDELLALGGIIARSLGAAPAAPLASAAPLPVRIFGARAELNPPPSSEAPHGALA